MASNPKRRRKRGKSTSDSMRIVVAAGPDAGVSLATELELAKAALVYGDAVTIISPLATMFSRLKELGTADARTQVELGARLAPWLSSGEEAPVASAGFQAILESLDKKPGTLSSRDLWLRSELASQMAPISEELAAVVSASLKNSGFDQLDQAAARGLIKFESCDPGDPLDLMAECVMMAKAANDGAEYDSGFIEELLGLFLDKLGEYLSRGRDYLLFDGAIASLIDEAISTARVRPTDGPTRRSAQAMNALGLMERLPSFPHAGVDEILDIRDELAPTVVPMRSAMVSLSKEFSSRPWEPSFADEVLDAWTETVHPAIADIESAVQENRSLLKLSRDMVHGAGLALPGLAVVADGLATHAPLATVAGGILSAAGPVLDAAWKNHVDSQKIRERPFYFLYQLKQSLS